MAVFLFITLQNAVPFIAKANIKVDCLWLDIGADFHFILRPSDFRFPPTVSLMMVANQLNSLRGNFVGLVSPAVFRS